MSITNHRIAGVEAFREAAWASDLSTVQLAPGCMGGSILHAVSDAGSISLGQFDRSMRARGILAPAGHVAFGLLLEVEGSSVHWGSEGSAGDVGVVPGQGEHDAVHHGAVSYLVLTLSTERLAAEFEQRPQLRNLLDAPRMWKGPPAASLAARATGRCAALALTGNPAIWSNEASRQCLLDEVAESVLDVVCSEKPTLPSQSRSAARRLVKHAEELVRTQRHELRIDRIAASLQVGRRTLHRAFLEHVGQPPARYLLHRRLSLVREALSGGEAASVGDAALRHGFWDFGRFAMQYRRLFGESPSKTLTSCACSPSAGCGPQTLLS